MKASEIGHVKIGTAPDICGDELSLATLSEARELLGYAPDNEVSPYPDTLCEALATLGIEVLDWREVLVYQAETVHAARLEQVRRETDLPSSRSSFAYKNWNQTPLKDWKQPIPLHVIEKANQIKKRVPGVEFFVEALSDTPDPFLVAKIDHPRHTWMSKVEYFIDVWEEPRFETR